MIKIFRLVATTLFVCATTAQAQESAASVARARNPSDVLRGTTGFNLSIETNAAVDTAAIRKNIEQTLQQAGIKTGPRETSQLQVLCVTLPDPKSPTIPWSCIVKVRQLITRNVPSPMQFVGILWETSHKVSIAMRATFAATLTGDIEGLVADFADAWTTANPKK
ncbi:MAG: hypothetical protein ABJC26_02095 [Gemmatimonadaceae bacterium]